MLVDGGQQAGVVVGLLVSQVGDLGAQAAPHVGRHSTTSLVLPLGPLLLLPPVGLHYAVEMREVRGGPGPVAKGRQRSEPNNNKRVMMV